MRKLFLIMILCCMMLYGCSRASWIHVEGIHEIKYEELINNLQSDVTFMVYIGREDCGDCIEFYPVLQEYILDHEKSGLFYVDVKHFRDEALKEDASKEEKDFFDHIYENLSFDWTPTIHVISKGKVVDSYQYLDLDYGQISDRIQQIKRKEEYLRLFEEFMDKYFKEDHT